VVEQAKIALVELERLDDQQAFIDLRRAARSSRPKPTNQAAETVAGPPMRRGRPSRLGRVRALVSVTS